MTMAAVRSSGGEAARSLYRSLVQLSRRPLTKALFAAQAVAAVVILVRMPGWLQPAELLVYDALRAGWAGAGTSDRILLVGATEDDVTAAGADEERRWAWPLRDGALAVVLERLASWHPQAIGVDLYRDVPEPPGSAELLAVQRRHPEIYWVFKLGEDGRRGIPPPKALRGTDQAVLADTLTDDDSVMRRALLFASDGKNQQYTGLGTALAEAYLAAGHIAWQAGDGDDLRLGKALIRPLDESRGPYVRVDSRGYQMLMDYRGGPQPFQQRSLSDIMDHDDAASLVKGRLVIIGVAAESVKDLFATPFSTRLQHGDPINGIAVHAHVADQLIREALDGTAILDGLPRSWENVWIWGWAVAGALLGLALRSTVPSVIGAFAGTAIIGAVVYSAFGNALLLPALPAIVAWIGATALTNQVLYATVYRARATLRKSFEHYLPPLVVDRLVARDELPALGGERREISVLFTDVAGFTTFSEGRDPQELAEITNEYLDGVCAAIFAHEGLVNSFMGDGVLAFFGAPQEQFDHADRAVSAAFSIDRFSERFRREQLERGVEFGETRIGIHTGIAFVGNVGSHQRLQYTALGDILNTGSRLEGLNKLIGGRICVSRETVDKCTRHAFRTVGEFIVKGRRGATEVFAPVDPQQTTPETVACYELAYRLLSTDRGAAQAQFEAMHQDDPGDPCIRFHYDRLQRGEPGVLIEMHDK